MVAFQLVTVGQPISEYAAKLFARNAYRDYLEVHGLSVQLTEALAEHWHAAGPARSSAFGGDATRPTWPAFFKLDYRGCPLLVRLPGLPGPGGPGEGARAAAVRTGSG